MFVCKRQILTEEQSAIPLVRPPFRGGFDFNISGIEFTLDTASAACAEMAYLCVEIGRGDAAKADNPIHPNIPFEIVGVEAENDTTPNPDNLIGCSLFPQCNLQLGEHVDFRGFFS